MKYLLTLLLSIGFLTACTNQKNCGMQLGDRAAVTSGFYEGCLATAEGVAYSSQREVYATLYCTGGQMLYYAKIIQCRDISKDPLLIHAFTERLGK